MSEMNQAQIQVFDFNPSDFEGVLELVRHEYGEADISDRDFFSWQAFNNSAGEALITISKELGRERILGLYVVNPMRIQLQDDEILGSVAINLIVHPDARRQGLFTRLAERAYQNCSARGISLTYGFPNPTALPGHTRKLNSPNIGDVPLFIKALDPESIFKSKGIGSLISGIAAATYRSFLAVWALFVSQRTDQVDVEIEEIFEFDDAFDQFWESIKHKHVAWLIRDQAFLSWRYRDIPIRSYRIFTAKVTGQIEAYLVLRIMDFEGVRCGMLVDFVVGQSQTSKSSGVMLLKHVMAVLGDESVELAGCLMQPYTEEAALLKSQGFMRCPGQLLPQTFPVIMRVHQNHDRLAHLYQLNNWFFTMGDFDVI